MGPTDWLVLTEEVTPSPAERLSEAFVGSSFRATDVSSAFVRMKVEGSDARALLSKACSMDVSATTFPVGRSVRARFVGMPVIVRCREPSTFELISARSYRDYLVAWLADAAQEFSEPGL